MASKKSAGVKAPALPGNSLRPERAAVVDSNVKASPLPTVKRGPVRVETVGKRLTKRQREVHQTDDGLELFLEPLAGPAPLDLRKLQAEAAAELKAQDIPVEQLLEEAPGGSRLVDHVLSTLGQEWDSRPGLAAIVLKLATHLEQYLTAGAAPRVVASLAYRLGWYQAVRAAYSAEANQIAAAALAGGEARRTYGPEERAHWKELRAGKLSTHSARRAAELIAKQLGYPPEAVETIRKAIAPEKAGKSG